MRVQHQQRDVLELLHPQLKCHSRHQGFAHNIKQNGSSMWVLAPSLKLNTASHNRMTIRYNTKPKSKAQNAHLTAPVQLDCSLQWLYGQQAADAELFASRAPGSMLRIYVLLAQHGCRVCNTAAAITAAAALFSTTAGEACT